MRGRKKTHGMTKHPVYSVWFHMRERCRPGHEYGEKGITVCDEWQKFETFYSEFGYGFKQGLTIDRIDNSKGYSKENCRWATRKQQARNRSDNVLLEWEGKKYTMAELAEKYEIPYSCFFIRLKKCKWSLKKAITTPILTKSDRGKISAQSSKHVNNIKKSQTRLGIRGTKTKTT